MEQILQFTNFIGLSPAYIGVAVVMSLLIRLARGGLPKFGPTATYITAALLAPLGAWLKAADGAPVKETVYAALALTALILVLQMLVWQQLAKIVPWIPEDNQWVKPAATPSPNAPGGK